MKKLPTERIMDNYDTFLKILKFSIKHDDDSQYQDFSLVDSYIKVLKEIEENLDEAFEGTVRTSRSNDFEVPLEETDFEELLEVLLYEENEEDKDYDKDDEILQFKMNINEDKKKELIRRFEIVVEQSDCALDRCLDDKDDGPLWRFEVIDKELNKILTCFSPILKIILKNKE